MKSFTPSDYERAEILYDLTYEIHHLLGYMVFLKREMRKPEPDDSVEGGLHYDLYLEGFLLHLRVLLGFFERTRRTQRRNEELDDVLSSDFGFAAAPIDIEPELRHRINQEIAHLTYTRVHRRPRKDWYPATMLMPVLVRLVEFSGHMAQQQSVRMAPEVAQRFEQIPEIVEDVLSMLEA